MIQIPYLKLSVIDFDNLIKKLRECFNVNFWMQRNQIKKELVFFVEKHGSQWLLAL